MDRRKRYRQTVALMSMLSETKTIDNVDTATFDGNGANLLSLIVGVDPVQSGSGDPSPENIRPITGWTECNISHSGADTSDLTIYTIAFPSEAGTVYGGTLDVVRKKLTVDRVMLTLDGTTPIALENWRPQANSVGWVYPYAITGNYVTNQSLILQDVFSDKLKSVPYNEIFSNDISSVSAVIYQTPPYSLGIVVRFEDTSLTTRAAINAYLAEHPISVCYRVATPIVYDLADAPTIQTFAGENNIWADTGKIIFLEYEA